MLGMLQSQGAKNCSAKAGKARARELNKVELKAEKIKTTCTYRVLVTVELKAHEA
jgi:hypothetical protein